MRASGFGASRSSLRNIPVRRGLPSNRLPRVENDVPYQCRASNVPPRQLWTLYAKRKPPKRTLSSSAVSPSVEEDLAQAQDPSDDAREETLLDPREMVADGILPMIKGLSPSSAAEFKACPQSFLFQYVLGLRQPTNPVLAKGIMIHTALERLYDLSPPERTLPTLKELLRRAWKENRDTEQYQTLFRRAPAAGDKSDALPERDLEAERRWGEEAMQLLENYYRMEDPRLIQSPNPIRRELWVVSKLSVDPALGVTSPNSVDTGAIPDDVPRFLVRGIVDRLDLALSHRPDHRASVRPVLRIIDYKSGKAPDFKYSLATNERIAHEKFWQLKIYALLVKEMMANNKGGLPKQYDLQYLRLLFLTSSGGEGGNDVGDGKYLDMNLGESPSERNRELHKVHCELADIWTQIVGLIAQQDPAAFVHCDRSFCYCHTLRPKFKRGTVWERPSP